MHRQILGLVPNDGMIVDHINQDKLDNRRENLRIVTMAMNKQNGKAHKDAMSQHVGVHFDARRGKWAAQATVNGRKILSKRFGSELEAARAYDEACRAEMPGYVGRDNLW